MGHRDPLAGYGVVGVTGSFGELFCPEAPFCCWGGQYHDTRELHSDVRVCVCVCVCVYVCVCVWFFGDCSRHSFMREGLCKMFSSCWALVVAPLRGVHMSAAWEASVHAQPLVGAVPAAAGGKRDYC